MNNIKINFNVARFLRHKFGFTLEQVVVNAKIKDIKGNKKQPGIKAVEYLKQIEDGSLCPTKVVLENLAALYRVPVLTFFLQKPPVFQDELIDFRTFDSRRPKRDNPLIFAIKRKIKLLQTELSRIEYENNKKTKRFVGSVTPDTAIVDFVNIVREQINFSFEEQKTLKKKDDIFKVVRSCIERLGIFVVQIGDLGSHHTSIPTAEFRGIAISDKYAPLIVVNPNDTQPAQLFSLLHEVAHIFLGDTAISNVGMANSRMDEKEKICNAFAAEFLLPYEEVQKFFDMRRCKVDEVLEVATELGNNYRVSNMVVIRRLYDARKITKDVFNEANNIIAANFKKRKILKKNNGGPNKNIVDRSRLGERTIQAINFATETNLMSPVAAAAILGINVGRLHKVIS